MCAQPVSRETHAGEVSPGADPSVPGVSRETRRRSPSARVLLTLLLAPIRFYRRFVSPALPDRCKYYPTCSTYAVQALRELGPFKGTIVAAWRVLRCNPLSSGGLDPLESRRLFRSDTPEEAPDQAGATV